MSAKVQTAATPKRPRKLRRLSDEQLGQIRQPLEESSPWIEIRGSAIHGRGVYAAKAIPSGTRIIEYIGELISKKESDRRDDERVERLKRGEDGSVYIFDLNRRFDMDGNLEGNPARLINHSCAPNCESQRIRGRIWIVSRRDIAAGEELTFDYGFDMENWRLHPCRCGTEKCIGYIVSKSQRWRVRRIIARERRGARAAKTT